MHQQEQAPATRRHSRRTRALRRRWCPLALLRAVSLAGVSVLLSSVLVACGTGQNIADNADYPERMVLADSDNKDNYHPASGYGQAGISPVYDGLLRPSPDDGADRLPVLKPALAAAEPMASNDAQTWTVKLREGVTFSDGSTFDAKDVKATYDVARDINKGSEVSYRYNLIRDIQILDPHTVAFHLSEPYASFPARMTLAIAPSEIVGQGTVSDSPLATSPVGTGPYVLESNAGNELRFKARDDYWGGAAQVKELVISLINDDQARAQRVASGEVSGASVPGVIAKSFADRDDIEVVDAKAVDWRGISLPDVPLFADPAVRRAINIAVDRDAIVAGPLSGYGTPISTVLSPVYKDAHNDAAVFPHDVAAAEKMLDEAGWVKGTDGIREKNGEKASVTLYYTAEDTLRRDIAIEFAAQMKKIGVEFRTEGASWDVITPNLTKAAAVLAEGAMPYDPDLISYDLFHTRESNTSEYSNPGNFGSAELNQLMEQARVEQDAAKRAKLYRTAQQRYVDNPSAVFLANVDHTYLQRKNKWNKGPLILEPHIHGTTWGPWWNIRDWTK